MALIDPAIAIVLEHEGGYVNNPDDKGGPTKYGITQATLSNYLGVSATPGMVQGMSENMAKAIYQKLYITPLKLDKINDQELADIILDLAVLRGIGGLVRDLQAILDLKQDGIMGSETLAKINSIVNPKAVGLSIINFSQLHFVAIALNDITQQPFLMDWIKRTQDLLRLLI